MLVSNRTVSTECYHLFTTNGWADSYNELRALSEAVWAHPNFRCSANMTRPFSAPHQNAIDDDKCTFKRQASDLLYVIPLVRFYADMKTAQTNELSAADWVAPRRA